MGLRQSKNTDMERGGYSRYLKVDSFLFIIAEFQYNNLIKITRWSFDDLRSFSFSAVIRNSDKESVTVRYVSRRIISIFLLIIIKFKAGRICDASSSAPLWH